MTFAIDGIRIGMPEPLDMPRWRRRLNGVVDGTRVERRLAGRLTVERLCDAAARRTGIDTIDAPPGLTVLVDALHAEAGLNAFGVLGARALIVNGLSARAELAREEAAHPGFAGQALAAPLVIVGLNRTGTTFLHRVLCEDPAARWLPFWLTLAPSPVPTTTELERGRSARIRRARGAARLTSILAPSAEEKHELGVDEPEEESPLMMQSFSSPTFFGAFSVPTYLDWVMDQDQTPAYDLLHRWLALYESRLPGDRWVLKNPFHLPFLPALVDRFPDARIVMTHRDPVKSVTSTVDLFEQYQMIGTSVPNRVQTTDATVRFCREALTRAMAAVDALPAEQVLHVHYRDLVADPMRTVEHIYAHAGMDLTAVARQRLRARAERPRDGAAPKSYSPAALGLSSGALAEAFENYSERFDVPREV